MLVLALQFGFMSSEVTTPSLSISRKVSGSVKWKAPPSGVWKINVDGAFQQVTRCGGMSFVIRDFTGSMVAEGACPLRGLISAEHAELLTCDRAVDFAIAQGLQPFIF